MSSKTAQLIGPSLISSNLNRSLMSPSPLSTIGSLNVDLNLVNGNSGGGGGGGGGTSANRATNNSNDSIDHDTTQSFLNGLNTDSIVDSNSLFSFNNSNTRPHAQKAHFLPQNYPLHQHQQNQLDQLNLFEMHQQTPSSNGQRCGICGTEPMINGKTLVGCLHSFCQPCLIQSTLNGLSLIQSGLASSIITCPICSQETLIPNGGIDALMPSFSNQIFTNSLASNDFSLIPAFKASYLSSSSSISSSSSSSSTTTTNSSPQISNYPKNNNNNNNNNFSLGLDSDSTSNEQSMLLKRQQIQLQQNRLIQIESDIQKTFSFYVQSLSERRDTLIKELHAIFQFVIKQNQHSKLLLKQKQQLEENSTNTDEQQDLQLLINNHLMSIEFVTNFNQIQSSIRNSFGYIRYSNSSTNTNNSNDPNVDSGSATNETSNYRPKPIGPSSSYSHSNDLGEQTNTADYLIEQFVSNINSNQIMGSSNSNTNQGVKQQTSATSNLKSQNSKLTTQVSNGNARNATSWSSVVAASTQNRSQTNQPHHQVENTSNEHQFDLNTSAAHDEALNNSLLANTNPLPAKSQIKRAKMIYSCKFGEFGVNEGQFTEPSGVSIGASNDIIVADTNSHRIQIFDSEGRFKFKFGECGKREGQLLYPNRVAVVKSTGDIVVTERSPTHQIQIYNQYGHFLRKFGANILQHPRGVCVDSKNRIIVVECKVMRVIIFDLMGNVLQKFNCSKYLEFPNGCCCSNDREEIFISDNRAHCIKVFNYEGQFLRQIGGEGITNYPIGVGINSNGEVLVADNHNNFNLTVFNQDGQMINALESKVKHAQCFDVGLMDDGSIVLASKDYRIYVYKYNSQQNANVSSVEYSNSNANSNQGANSSQTSLINSINAFNNF